jgi:hypothetical protein
MAIKMTPAMAAGLTRKLWYYEDIIELIERKKREALKPSGLVPLRRP